MINVCEHKHEGNRFTCVKCGRIVISSARKVWVRCANEMPQKKSECKHLELPEKFWEQCPTCKSEKTYPAYWCKLLNMLCCRTHKLPYVNCNFCIHWEAGNV